ncbi:hypothetical protein RB653_004048 [Dictyostelium firmibasis]|uniref:Uncharacterized protein n=1 Tax=Dictyostelium firmibasis TaxID=79012 RepID=A0AAN7U933_9MYCE
MKIKLIIFFVVFIGLINISISENSGCVNGTSEDCGIYFYTYETICSFSNSIRDEDEYELYYVQAPLLYATYGNLLEKINAYHSGIALYNKNGGPNISLDFFAYPSFENTLLPKSIIKDENGNYNITWDTYALIEVTNYINETYWNKRELIMYDITGSQVKQYLNWAPYYNKTHTFYNLFGIESASLKNDSSIIYKNSFTCDDFVWESFNIFYQLGGSMGGVQSDPPRDEITLFTTVKPTIVDYNNATERNLIATFYLDLMDLANLGKNQTALQIFNNLISLFNGSFYCFIDGVYYKMNLSKQSPISFTYLPSPMPTGKRDSSAIKKVDYCRSKIPINDQKK